MMTKKQESAPGTTSNQNARLDKRISNLEVIAKSAEERARYAEMEARLRKRITDAQKKIAENSPPGMFSGLAPGLAGKMPKGKAKVWLILVGVVALVLIIAKACGGS